MNASTGTARTYVAICGLLALGALFGSLGAWQLRRADDSRATLARFETGAEAAPLATVPRALGETERFRRLELRGEFVGEPQFLLDNMLHDGVAGYHVLTALRVPGLRELVLVNRGWVGTGGDRRVLPDVAVTGGVRRVTGRLERLPRPGLRLGTAAAAGPAHGTLVLQYPTAAELADLFGEPVLDFELLLDAGEPDGFVREWRAPALAPERHWAYAGQWFVLAVGAVAASLVMTYRALRRKP